VNEGSPAKAQGICCMIIILHKRYAVGGTNSWL